MPGFPRPFANEDTDSTNGHRDRRFGAPWRSFDPEGYGVEREAAEKFVAKFPER